MLTSIWQDIVSWWYSGSDLAFGLWLLIAPLGILLFVWLSYNIVRFGLGDHKINGVWISPTELESLLDRLQVREHDGGTLHARDVNLLDRFRPDRRLHLKRLGDKDYVAW